MPLKATYAASKRFLLDLAISLCQELKNENVHVLTICPGGMVTTQRLSWNRSTRLLGTVTTNPLECVARNAIDRVWQVKTIYVPEYSTEFFSSSVNHTSLMDRCSHPLAMEWGYGSYRH